MKKVILVIMVMASLAFVMSCNKLSYRKTNSGLAYIIFPGNDKDSTIRDGNVIKLHVISKLNDSVLYSSYDEVPAFWQYRNSERPVYNFMEILPQMRKGDSAITIAMVDTLLSKGAQVPPGAKKGDRIITTINILHIYRTDDSIVRADYMANETRRMEIMQKKSDDKWEKSGEIAKEFKEIEAYLQSRNINAQKTGKGTYVSIEQQGSGPQAENGKYVKVKYTGKTMDNDSTFESGVYPFQLGKNSAIRGWDEGLLLFKQGGKGTMFVPGFLAYFDSPQSKFKPFANLRFDVELLEVSDNPISADPPQLVPPKN